MPKYKDIVLSAAEAFDIYVERYPDTAVIEIELELESRSYVYQVKGFDEEKEFKLYINPYNNKIIEVNEKISKDMFTNILRKHTDKIQEFVDDAMEDAGNNSKLDDGVLELEVEIILDNGEDTKYKYNIITEDLIKKK